MFLGLQGLAKPTSVFNHNLTTSNTYSSAWVFAYQLPQAPAAVSKAVSPPELPKESARVQ